MLLDPKEHVPFLQYAVRNWSLKHPGTGVALPVQLPATAFPDTPDAQVCRWHQECGEILRRRIKPSRNATAEVEDTVGDLKSTGGQRWQYYSRFRRMRHYDPPEFRPESGGIHVAEDAELPPSRGRDLEQDTSRQSSQIRNERRSRSRSRSRIRNLIHAMEYTFKDGDSGASSCGSTTPLRGLPTRRLSLPDLGNLRAELDLPSWREQRGLSRALNDEGNSPNSQGVLDNLGMSPADASLDEPLAVNRTRTVPDWRMAAIGQQFVGFVGAQNTAWFVLVCGATASAIFTVISARQADLPPECPPERLDSNHCACIAQTVLSACSLYYFVVPFCRDRKIPVRTLFYVTWLVSIGTSVAAPLVYERSWRTTVWLCFGAGICQAAASAFLFEKLAFKEISLEPREQVEETADDKTGSRQQN